MYSERVATIFLAFIIFLMGFIAAYAIATAQAAHCFEDEAIMWDGNDHTICVPVDDIR